MLNNDVTEFLSEDEIAQLHAMSEAMVALSLDNFGAAESCFWRGFAEEIKDEYVPQKEVLAFALESARSQLDTFVNPNALAIAIGNLPAEISEEMRSAREENRVQYTNLIVLIQKLMRR